MQPKPMMNSNSVIIKTTPRLADLMLTLYSQGLVNIFILGKAIAPGIFHATAVDELVRPQQPANGLLSVITTDETPWLAEALEKELDEKNNRVVIRTVQTMEMVMVVDIPSSYLLQVAYSRMPHYPMFNGDMMRPVPAPVPVGPLQGYQRGEPVSQPGKSTQAFNSFVPAQQIIKTDLLGAFIQTRLSIDNPQLPGFRSWHFTVEGKLYQDKQLVTTIPVESDLHQAIDKLALSIVWPPEFLAKNHLSMVLSMFRDFYIGELLATLVTNHQLTTAQAKDNGSINVSFAISNVVDKEGLVERLLDMKINKLVLKCRPNNTVDITVK